MSESNQSQAPWRYLDYRVLDAKGDTIILIGRCEQIPHATAEANGHLVAAAPDLLEALKVVLAYVESVAGRTDGSRKVLQAKIDAKTIRAAIAKSKGES